MKNPHPEIPEGKLARYLAYNLDQLRRRKFLTQMQLAEAAGVPRTVVTQIESGVANPTLSSLGRIASALDVTIESLLARPERQFQLIRQADVPVEKKNQGKVRVNKVFPDGIAKTEMDLIEFDAEGVLQKPAHPDGTKEYLTILKGEVVVHLPESERSHFLKKGDVLAYPANQARRYANCKTSESVMISLLLPVPDCI